MVLLEQPLDREEEERRGGINCLEKSSQPRSEMRARNGGAAMGPGAGGLRTFGTTHPFFVVVSHAKFIPAVFLNGVSVGTLI